MKKRINFEAWGLGNLESPAYAMDNGIDEKPGCVASAIARKNGLQVITLKSEGTALNNGKPYENHYSSTLGYPCSEGGWTPVKQVWFSIPLED